MSLGCPHSSLYVSHYWAQAFSHNEREEFPREPSALKISHVIMISEYNQFGKTVFYLVSVSNGLSQNIVLLDVA